MCDAQPEGRNSCHPEISKTTFSLRVGVASRTSRPNEDMLQGGLRECVEEVGLASETPLL